MKVFGVSMVRNEADIIGTTVLHHLSLGLDRILVLDNGSTDGTGEILRNLAEEDERVRYISDDSPFKQAEITTRLVRRARREGADWVLPFDADEFWWAEGGGFREILSNSEAGALKVPFINFVQARGQHESSLEALLTMTRRVAEPVEFGPRCRELVESHKIGFVEMRYPGKWISRPRPEFEVRRGNHKVIGINGLREECDDIVCLHAPLRSREILESKVERRRRLDEAVIPRSKGAWHVHRWARIFEEGLLDQEWAANSYEGEHLDVYGEKHQLTIDTRLRDAVAVYMPDTTGKVLASAKPSGRTRVEGLAGSSHLRPLFVAGCQRSGTTAFAEYLNDHPEVLVCQERYKYIPQQVTPDHFDFERILDYGESETNMPHEWYEELLVRKNPTHLRWIGDKNPGYYKYFGRLLRQNPGAKFIVLYRPLEEVAESFEARAQDTDDPWPSHYDFDLSIKLWNLALNSTRKFIESGRGANVLIVGYDDFFYRNEVCIPLISRFLGIEFDEPILADWQSRSAQFERIRRPKNALSEAQISLIREHKDLAAEEWILDRIEQQRRDPEALFVNSTPNKKFSPKKPSTLSRKQRIEDLQRTLEEELRRAERLRTRNRQLESRTKNLARQLRGIQGSRSWRLLQKLGRAKTRIVGKLRR